MKDMKGHEVRLLPDGGRSGDTYTFRVEVDRQVVAFISTGAMDRMENRTISVSTSGGIAEFRGRKEAGDRYHRHTGPAPISLEAKADMLKVGSTEDAWMDCSVDVPVAETKDEVR